MACLFFYLLLRTRLYAIHLYRHIVNMRCFKHSFETYCLAINHYFLLTICFAVGDSRCCTWVESDRHPGYTPTVLNWRWEGGFS